MSVSLVWNSTQLPMMQSVAALLLRLSHYAKLLHCLVGMLNCVLLLALHKKTLSICTSGEELGLTVSFRFETMIKYNLH